MIVSPHPPCPFVQCLHSDKDAINQKSRCCSISSDFDPLANNHSNMPMPPGPPKSHPPRSSADAERMSEKYWGEILERTLSSTSLHALQQSFSGGVGGGSYCRTPLAHHNNRFNHSPSVLTNQTSVLSLNHIARDIGYDPFRSDHLHHPHHYNLRHSFMLDNGDARAGSGSGCRKTESDAEDGEEDEEDDDEEGEEEEDEVNAVDLGGDEETSNSDSVQDELIRTEHQQQQQQHRHNGPRVSFISSSETRLNDFSLHDKNCAKAKAAFNAQIQSVKGLPGM